MALQLLRNHHIAAAHARKAALLGKGTELNGAVARAGNLKNGPGNIRILNKRLIG